MLERAKSVLQRVLLFAPWVILLTLVTLAMLVPSILQDTLTNIEASSLVSRLGIIALVYGGISVAFYRRNPKLINRLLSRSNSKVSEKVASTGEVDTTKTHEADEPRFAMPSFGRKKHETATVEDNSSGTALDSVASINEKPSETEVMVDDTPMNEDDFYSFLESVAEDKEDKKEAD